MGEQATPGVRVRISDEDMAAFLEAARQRGDVAVGFRAELRKREDGLYGVIWAVDSQGNGVLGVQLEQGPMKDCLGSRMSWKFYLDAFASCFGLRMRESEGP